MWRPAAYTPLPATSPALRCRRVSELARGASRMRRPTQARRQQQPQEADAQCQPSRWDAEGISSAVGPRPISWRQLGRLEQGTHYSRARARRDAFNCHPTSPDATTKAPASSRRSHSPRIFRQSRRGYLRATASTAPLHPDGRVLHRPRRTQDHRIGEGGTWGGGLRGCRRRGAARSLLLRRRLACAEEEDHCRDVVHDLLLLHSSGRG